MTLQILPQHLRRAISTRCPSRVRNPSRPKRSRLASAAKTPDPLRLVSRVKIPGCCSPV
jgi:hypothetical protein